MRVLLSGLGDAPSGTVARVEASESYRFLDGGSLALETLPHDLAVYRRGLGGAIAGEDGSARFFLAPLRGFEPGAIEGGRIDLSVFDAAREALPIVLDAAGGAVLTGTSELRFTSGSLSARAAMQLVNVPKDGLAASFPSSLRFIAAARLFALGLSGAVEARFRAPAPGEADGPALILEERVLAGRALLVLAGEGAIAGGFVEAALSVADGSSWILARAADGTGSVAGRVLRGGAPAGGAVVTASGTALAAISGADGSYRLIAAAGKAVVRALVESTGESASGEAQVESGQTAALDLVLAAEAPRVLSIAPADGETNVSLGTSVLIRFSEPLDEASFTEAAVAFTGPDGSVDAERFLLPGATSAVLRPKALLKRLTTYEVAATAGLTTRSGTPFAPARARFTTLDDTPPKRPEAGQITMSMPDPDGVVTIAATQGAVNPGTAVTAVNTATGATATVVAGGDGAFAVNLRASRTDRVKLLFRDTAGNETEFSPGLFDSGQGAAIVTPDGGTMVAPDGTKLIFQPGAFAEPTQVTFERFDEARSPIQVPQDFKDKLGLSFAAGLSFTAEGRESQNNIKVRLPLGNEFPDGSKFLVARVDEIAGRKELVLLDDAEKIDGVVHIDTSPFGGIFIQAFVQITNILLMGVTGQGLTFVQGRVLKAPRLGVINISINAEAVPGTDLHVVASAQPLVPGVTVTQLLVAKRIQFLPVPPDQLGREIPGSFFIPQAFAPAGQTEKVIDAIVPIALTDVNSFFKTLSQIGAFVENALPPALQDIEIQMWRAIAEFKNAEGTFVEAADVSTMIVPDPDRVTGDRNQGAKHVHRKDPRSAKPARGAWVEVFNGIGRNYPTSTITGRDGSFVLALKPDPPGQQFFDQNGNPLPPGTPPPPPLSYLRVFDPLTGNGTGFPMNVPNTLFDFVDVGDLFVPETQGDTKPPAIEIQVTGTLQQFSPIEINIQATDDKGLGGFILRYRGGVLDRQTAVGGTSFQRSYQVTTGPAGEHPIELEFSDTSGNTVKRKTVVNVRRQVTQAPQVTGIKGVSLEPNSVDMPLDLEVTIGVTTSPSVAVEPGFAELQAVQGLEVAFVDPVSLARIPVVGCFINKENIRVRPVVPLPPETCFDFVVNGEKTPFCTDGVDKVSAASLTFVEIRGLAIQGATLFVADFGAPDKSVNIVDLSDLDNPRLLASLPFLGGCRAVAVPEDGTPLLVAVGGGQGEAPTLRAYDVSDPANPKKFATVTLFPITVDQFEVVIPIKARVQGNLAFVCSIGAGVQVVDLEEAARIALIPFNQRTGPQQNGQIAVVGGFRLPDPDARPALVGSPFDVALGIPSLVLTGGGATGRLFVLSRGSGAFLNLLPTPSFQAPFVLPEPIQRVAGVETVAIRDLNGDGAADFESMNLAVASHGNSGRISVINLTTPANPALIGTVNNGGPAFDLAIGGGFVFTGHRIISVIDPDHPIVSQPLSHQTVDGSAITLQPGGDAVLQPLGRAASGGRLFLAASVAPGRARFQTALLHLPAGLDDLDFDIVRTTEYEPKINVDDFDYLSTGDPVNPFTGEMVMDESDLAIPGRGLNFAFVRTYRSQIEFNGPLGHGWDHNLNDRLTEVTFQSGLAGTGGLSIGDVIRHDGSGRTDVFKSGSSGYVSPKGNFEVLRKAGLDFVLEEPDGTKHTYARAARARFQFRLAKTQDRYGNAMEFLYNFSDQLFEVRDSMGRKIGFSYSPKGKLVQILDFIGRTIDYVYDCDDNLVAVTGPKAPPEFPDGKTTRYAYTAGFQEFNRRGERLPTARLNHNLLTVTDPKGQTYLTLDYYPTLDHRNLEFDRIFHQRLGCDQDPVNGGPVGGTFEFSYQGTAGGGAQPPHCTLATTRNRSGHVTRRHYNALGNLEMLVVETARLGPLTSLMSYDNDGLLLSSITPRGMETVNEYSPGASRLRQADLRKVTVTPAPAAAPPGQSPPPPQPPRPTEIQPGPFGVPLSIKDPKNITTSYDVDPRGNIRRIFHPLGVTEQFGHLSSGQIDQHVAVDGTVTQFTYHPAPDGGPGYLRSMLVHPDLGGPNAIAAGAVPYSIPTTFGYDLVGNVTSNVDPRGKPTNRVVNALNQITSETDPRGTISYTYDANDNVETIQDLGGLSYLNEYNCLDLLVRVTETSGPLTRAIEYGFDPSENPKIVREALGHRRIVEYEERGLAERVSTEGGPNPVTGIVSEHEYDEDGNLVRLADAEGKAVRYTYNGFNELESVTDPNGNRTEFAYEIRGLVEKERSLDANGNLLREVRSSHDDLGRLVKVVEPILDIAGNPTGQEDVTTTEYEPGTNHLSKIKDGLGRSTDVEYDGLDRLVFRRDPAGNEEATIYDGLDPRVTIRRDREPDGSMTVTKASTRFDTLGRPQESKTEGGGETRTTRYLQYDVRDNIRLIETVGGETIESIYDGFDRLTLTRKGREVIEHTYDLEDRVIGRHDGRGKGIVLDYDGRDRLRTVTYEDGSTEQFSYNVDDTLFQVTDRAGNVLTHTYDDGNRHLSVAVIRQAGFEATDLRTFSYDGLDRITQAVDQAPSGSRTVKFGYDSRGLALEAHFGSRILKAVYDKIGDRIQLTHPGARAGSPAMELKLTPDSLSRMKRVEHLLEPGRQFANFEFSGPNLVARAAYANSTASSRSFNGVREEIERRFTGSGNQLLTGFEYAHDLAGRIRGVAKLHEGGRGDAYVFNTEAWLEEALLGVADPLAQAPNAATAASRVKFEHDASGNLLRRIKDGVALGFTPDDLNQYAQVGGASLKYDLNGNLRSDGKLRFSYDVFEQLVSIEEIASGATLARYEYDALGRRAKETTPAGVEEYIYDDDEIVLVLDGEGNPKRSYVSGHVVDRPVLMRVGNQDFYYQFDGTGSVAAIADASGSIVERYVYDPDGNPTILAPDGTIRSTSAVGNRRMFMGMYSDPGGLICMRAREYSPSLGRFLQPDPAGTIDSLNLYAYAGNDPIDFADPTGLYRQASADNMKIGSMGPFSLMMSTALAKLAVTSLRFGASLGRTALRLGQKTYRRIRSSLRSGFGGRPRPGRELPGGPRIGPSSVVKRTPHGLYQEGRTPSSSNMTPLARSYLERLRRSPNGMIFLRKGKGKEDIDSETMASITRATGREVGLYRVIEPGGRSSRVLILGTQNELPNPRGTSRLIAHTHPSGTHEEFNINKRFSGEDIQVLRDFRDAAYKRRTTPSRVNPYYRPSSVVINVNFEGSARGAFTSRRIRDHGLQMEYRNGRWYPVGRDYNPTAREIDVEYQANVDQQVLRQTSR
ncbi:MAG: Ig-like domain-containing protein [Planctomycetes bacterium]|nr:Ig-like domain-containing protein [Planctomycetota bacterium]